MCRQEFLCSLNSILCNYPSNEVEKCLEYYNECISDRMENGMSEEEAVADLGDIYSIADNIKMEMPITTLVRQKVVASRDSEESVPKKRSAPRTVFMIIGIIFALPFIIAFLGIIFAVIVTLLALIPAFFCVTLALGISAVACLVAGIISIVMADSLSLFLYLGASLICASLTILFALITAWVTKGVKKATVGIIKGIKKMLIKKGA